MKLLSSLVVVVTLLPSAMAQLEPPNTAGIAMGEVHLLVSDVAAQQKFWTMLGATPVKNGSLTTLEMQGAFLILEPGSPAGGSAGDIVAHFGLFVKDIDSGLVKWRAAGIKFEQSNPKQAMITGPDGVMVEIHEDTTLSGPVKMHHIHFFGPDPAGMQAYYVKLFGAVPGKRGTFITGNLPGVELAFSKGNAAPLPTKGRSLEAIGFEVADLRATSKRLQADGVKFDGPVHKLSHSPIRVLSFTDPWGTTVELTQKLGSTN